MEEKLNILEFEVEKDVIRCKTDYNPFMDYNIGEYFPEVLKREQPHIGAYMTAINGDVDLIFCQWCFGISNKVYSETITECVNLGSSIDYSWSCAKIVEEIDNDPSWEPVVTEIEFDDDEYYDDEDFDDEEDE